MQPTDVPTSRSGALALIKTAMIEKKLTQAELADAADCHEKTIQNMLAGKMVREQTLFDACMVLGLDFERVRGGWLAKDLGKAHLKESGRTPDAAVQNGGTDVPGSGGFGGDIAPVYMGAYTRQGVDDYIGSYLTVRPALHEPDAIVAYRTDIVWDPEWPSLLFQERNRPDATYSHRGRLYMPPASMFLHLVSLTKGAMRMVVVSQLDQLGKMRGLMTTLAKRGASVTPVAAPIVYVRTDNFQDEALGSVARGSPAFERYRVLLDDAVSEGYARIVATPTA